MKIFVTIILSVQIFTAPTVNAQTAIPPRKPIEGRDIDKFNARLANIYQQENQNTLTQQIIYSSIEAVTAYHLNGLITKVDQKKLLLFH